MDEFISEPPQGAGLPDASFFSPPNSLHCRGQWALPVWWSESSHCTSPFLEENLERAVGAVFQVSSWPCSFHKGHPISRTPPTHQSLPPFLGREGQPTSNSYNWLLPLAAQRTYQETLNSSPCSPDREAGQCSQGSERALFRAEGRRGRRKPQGIPFLLRQGNSGSPSASV